MDNYEISLQANRLLRANDRSDPNAIIGISRVPFDDGTTLDFEFYKPAFYHHNGVHYEVVLSAVLSHYRGGEENAARDLTIYMILRCPNGENYDSHFTIQGYGQDEEIVSELVFIDMEELVYRHHEAYELYNFLHMYGEDGVVVKE